MSMTIEEVLAAVPEGEMILTLRNANGRAIVVNTPIHRPYAAKEPEYDLPTVVFAFNEGSGSAGGTFPVESVNPIPGGVTMTGPEGIAYLRKVDE